MAYYSSQMAAEVLQRMGKEKLNIVDVREIDEWIDGHIPGAVHVPLSEFGEHMHKINPTEETIIVCRSGGRSARACEYLAQSGYNVINMLGGMLDWQGEIEVGE
jgi:rhodanese-related sulfurtransferase